MALVGESGSGKSVTSMAIMRLLKMPPAIANTGSIIFSEPNLPRINLLNANEKSLQKIRGKKIAMIFQEPMSALNPLQRVGQQVAEVIYQHTAFTKKEIDQKIIALFTKIQLPNPETIGKKYPHELSGGQKQRVVIAMALSCKPQLIICDEPTTALDVTVQHEILTLLKQLQISENLSILFISHDLNVIAQIAHQIVVMYQGEIVETGEAKQVLNAPTHAYTKALLQCRPGNHPAKTLLPTVTDFLNPNAADIALRKSFVPKLPLPEKLISLVNLKVVFGGEKKWFGTAKNIFTAVNNVSFNIFKGEIVGLVGESGCGKTTIGRTIMGLNNLTAGNIIWHGEAAKNNIKSLQWQMVFQDPFAALNPKINIGNTIAEGIYVNKLASRNEALAIAKSWLQKVNLDAGHISRYPHEFSGGQRQRIVISRALALSPQFIICDESVSALDVSVQSQILNILLKLKNELGFSILFISHDMAVIQHICDRVLVMRKGQIVEEGNAQEIYNNPKEAYTKGLIAAIPRAV